jgi:hypothetical protein
MAGVAEFKPEPLLAYMKVCTFYFPKGFLHIFIGLLALQSGLPDPDNEHYIMVELLGWLIIIVGFMNILFGCTCYKEYDSKAHDEEGGESGGGGGGGGGGQGGNASRRSQAPAEGGNTYTYGGQQYAYNAGGPGAI